MTATGRPRDGRPLLPPTCPLCLPWSACRRIMQPKLPELIELERIIEAGKSLLNARIACNVEVKGERFPVYVLTMGSSDPQAPAVGFFGGVHGLERIGTRVLLAFLRSLLARLQWDPVLHHQLTSVRLVFMPLVNPGGMWNNTRCNRAVST